MEPAIGPATVTVDVEHFPGMSPLLGQRPNVVFNPQMPVCELGIRMDPPPSVPIPNGTIPEQTADAVPLELAPG